MTCNQRVRNVNIEMNGGSDFSTARQEVTTRLIEDSAQKFEDDKKKKRNCSCCISETNRILRPMANEDVEEEPCTNQQRSECHPSSSSRY